MAFIVGNLDSLRLKLAFMVGNLDSLFQNLAFIVGNLDSLLQKLGVNGGADGYKNLKHNGNR